MAGVCGGVDCTKRVPQNCLSFKPYKTWTCPCGSPPSQAASSPARKLLSLFLEEGILPACHEVAPDVLMWDGAAQNVYAKHEVSASILRSWNTHLFVLLSIDGNLTLVFACSWIHFQSYTEVGVKGVELLPLTFWSLHVLRTKKKLDNLN